MKGISLQVIDAKDQRKLARSRKLIDRACRLLRDAMALAAVGDGTVAMTQPATRTVRRAAVKTKRTPKRERKPRGGKSMTPGAIAARKRRAEQKARQAPVTTPPTPQEHASATTVGDTVPVTGSSPRYNPNAIQSPPDEG